ncbi:MAG: T9SS type A sorting domain-containing protein [Chlorobi bacterium]|nr:T9SS type A sorting domain-containing protein [Chlorobiota bacterium]
MKNIKLFFPLFAFVLFLSSSFAQDINKEVPNLPNYYTIGSDPTTAILSAEQPQNQSPAILDEVASKLREARLLKNSSAQKLYEQELDRISGSSTTTGQDSRIPEPIVIETDNNQSPPFNQDLVVTPSIHSVPNWCIATATVPVGWPGAGTIYAASGNYSAAGTDTMRVYRSTNGGVSWASYAGFLFGGTNNFNFVGNDLDMEICYSGTTSYLFLICRVNNATTGTHFIQCARYNLTTNAVTFFNLTFPGVTANNNYYNCRLTSDSFIYTSATYVYFATSFDTAEGSGRRVRQKYALLLTPFAAAITVTYRYPNAGGWWWHTAVPTGSYHWGDIVFFNVSSTDYVMTVTNFPTTVAFPSMYLAWSTNYGTSNSGSLTITEAVANITFGARIASNCINGNGNVMINYTRLFGGTDWDPYYRKTTNGGLLVANWTGNYVDASTARSRYVDVIGMVGVSNGFRSAYAQDSTSAPGGRNILYRTWTGTTYGGSYRMNGPVTPDTSFGKIRAGYRNGGGDDCFAVWASGNGNDMRAAHSCATTVGINGNNNGIPTVYSLSQNYPNPFNPVTNIKFAIPNGGLVKIAVYDITGREVAALVNQSLNAGSYTVDFDASSLSSGVYFYSISAGNFTDTKKMVLIK